MSIHKKIFRLALIATAIICLLVLSNLFAETILLIITGLIFIILGKKSAYKTISTAGILIITIGAAISINIDSMTEIKMIFTAIIGIFIPIFIFIWFGLYPFEYDDFKTVHSKKVLLITIIYISLCLMSIPISIFFIGIFSPTVSIHLSILTEIAIMLTVAIIGVIILLFRPSRSIISMKSAQINRENTQ